ncbi:MAG: ATP-binding protein [Patescibacteria group bacterium]
MSITRDITFSAQKYLATDEILLFIGARQAGKTTILKQLEKHLKEQSETVYFLNLEDPDYLTLLNASPKNLFKIFPIDLSKRIFLFIDEVQYLSNPSNFLKYFYDEYRGKIKILASGSSAFYLDDKFKDSLAGRKMIFNVFTLSFREFLRFKDKNELSQKDFNQLTLSEKEKINLYYREFIIYGGYPRVVLVPFEEKKEILRDIAYSYIKKDIFEAKVRQEEVFYKLFKILAAQIGNLVNASELANTLDVSKTSIDYYLYIMQKSFHLILLKPFFKNIRKELTKMPKIYFLDLGLRNFFVNNFQSFELREEKGALLENAVFRQLLDTYEADEIRYWRTIQKNEIDFVLDEERAIETKIQIEQFREKNFKVFLESYKNIKLFIATLDAKRDKVGPYEVLEVWGI